MKKVIYLVKFTKGTNYIYHSIVVNGFKSDKIEVFNERLKAADESLRIKTKRSKERPAIS